MVILGRCAVCGQLVPGHPCPGHPGEFWPHAWAPCDRHPGLVELDRHAHPGLPEHLFGGWEQCIGSRMLARPVDLAAAEAAA